jgi:protease-4
MAATELTRAFRAAVRDSAVRAILFRIDSPGGSAVASESIWREVVFARERGKPVIVSMSDVAGSGGYYVAAAADKIVAEPATLTGSIGVLAGKLVVADLLKKIGISTDSAQIGTNAAMYSVTTDFSAYAHNRLEAFLDETYKGFKDHVATGRHMTQDEVEAVAKGRVWSGEDAKAHGLVDELGGYTVALRLAKEAANLSPEAPFTLRVSPRRNLTRTPLQPPHRRRPRARRRRHQLNFDRTLFEGGAAATAAPRGGARQPRRADHAATRPDPVSPERERPLPRCPSGE